MLRDTPVRGAMSCPAPDPECMRATPQARIGSGQSTRFARHEDDCDERQRESQTFRDSEDAELPS